MIHSLERRWLFVFIMLVVTAGSAFLVKKQFSVLQAAPVSAVLPDSIGKWKTVESISFADRIIQVLGTSDVNGRIYQDDRGRQVEIILVKAARNRGAFHPPEYCMTGGGSELVGRGAGRLQIPSGQNTVTTLDYNEMIFQKDNTKLLVANWYYAGKERTSLFYTQQYKLILEQLLLKEGRGAVVNLYTEISHNGIDAARALMNNFMRESVPLIEKTIE